MSVIIRDIKLKIFSDFAIVNNLIIEKITYFDIVSFAILILR